jgi:hypothetical protein
MTCKTLAAVTLVLVCAAGGCSGEHEDRAAAARPAVSESTAAPTTRADASRLAEVCSFLEAEVNSHLLRSALAMTGEPPGPGLRAGVAAEYDGFANTLRTLAVQAPATWSRSCSIGCLPPVTWPTMSPPTNRHPGSRRFRARELQDECRGGGCRAAVRASHAPLTGGSCVAMSTS